MDRSGDDEFVAVLQHGQAESDRLRGQTLRELLALSFHEMPAASEALTTSILCLRTHERSAWQRFFLDAGVAFWGESPDSWVQEELEDSVVVDLAERFDIRGVGLDSVLAFPASPDGASLLHLHLSNGKRLSMVPTQPHNLDSPTRLDWSQGTPAESYRELLRVHDVPGRYEHPEAFGGPSRFCHVPLPPCAAPSPSQVHAASAHQRAGPPTATARERLPSWAHVANPCSLWCSSHVRSTPRLPPRSPPAPSLCTLRSAKHRRVARAESVHRPGVRFFQGFEK